MKPAHLAILLVILVLGIVNLLASLGVIGGSSSGSGGAEYRVLTPAEMDSIGFKAVAAAEGVEPDEEGKMNLPGAKVVKNALLKTTLDELKKEGWTLTGITPDSLYVFKK